MFDQVGTQAVLVGFIQLELNGSYNISDTSYNFYKLQVTLWNTKRANRALYSLGLCRESEVRFQKKLFKELSQDEFRRFFKRFRSIQKHKVKTQMKKVEKYLYFLPVLRFAFGHCIMHKWSNLNNGDYQGSVMALRQSVQLLYSSV